MKYYCPICGAWFKKQKEIKDNVYIVFGAERYNNSEKIKYHNTQFPFHLKCIEQFKKDKEYQIPDTDIFTYKMVIV